MPTDIIEMHWECVNAGCKASNLGRHKTCQNCGKPRTEDAREWLPDDISHQAAVQDEKLLKQATGGKDWSCKFCGSSQFRVDGNCAQCGSPQEQSVEAPPKRAQRKTPKVEDEAPAFVAQARPQPILQKKPILFLIAGGLAILLTCYLLFRSKNVDATVTGVSWERSVIVDRHTIHHDSGWDVPIGAVNVVDDGARVYSYEKVQVGTHRESYQASEKCGQDCQTVKGACRKITTPRNCKSNKNGFATCTGGDEKQVCSPDTTSCTDKMCPRTKYHDVPDYVDQPVYRHSYEWDMWTWDYNRTVVSNGTTEDPAWPSDAQVALSNDEAAKKGSETYKVSFSGGYTYSPASADEYKKFAIGDRHRLKVSTVRTEVIQ